MNELKGYLNKLPIKLTNEEKLLILTKEYLTTRNLMDLFDTGYSKAYKIKKKIKAWEIENNIAVNRKSVKTDSVIKLYPLQLYDVIKLKRKKLKEIKQNGKISKRSKA